MINNCILQTVMFGGAVVLGSSDIMAQTFGADYTTEWQTDFKGGYDWLNLLQVTAEAQICNGLAFQASTISTAKTGEEPLIEDLLTYSNIEAGNIALTFSRLGFAWQVREAEWFLGVNNVNEDYFTSVLTSFFTNSSCGISPTISCNYDIANYPLAAWCVHYRQQLGDVSLQTSLYPGQGYSRLLGHNNLFNLNFKRDGVFSISSIDYKKNGIYTVLGVALHRGMCMGDVVAEQELPETTPKKRFTAAPWLLSEIDLPHNLGVHLHASYASVKHGCKWYGGLGLIYSGKKVQPGLALNYASFTESSSEFTVELTCRIPLLSDKAYLQPALHIINTDKSSTGCIGMMRFNVAI